MSSLRLIKGAAFDAETTHLLGLAYEKAIDGNKDPAFRELVAKRIIEAARRGERDINVLATFARDGLDGSLDAAG
jgi:hypothetical protein